MRVNRWIVPVVAIVVMLGSVAGAQIGGWWQTSGTELVTIEDVSPEDIRGSSTLGDLAVAFDIPMGELFSILGIEGSYSKDTKLKDLTDIVEVGVARGLIAQHLGIPWEIKEHDDFDEEAELAPATPAQTSSGGATGEGEVTLAGADIKGRMTLAEVSEGANIPLEYLYQELSLNEEIPATMALKDITERVEGFKVSVVREIVDAYDASE